MLAFTGNKGLVEGDPGVQWVLLVKNYPGWTHVGWVGEQLRNFGPLYWPGKIKSS